MILGIGTDLLKISRMEKALKRHGTRLPERILHPDEMLRFHDAKRPANFLAKCFAAKEATVKALGLGFSGIGYRDVGWVQDARGKPELVFSAHGKQVMREMGASKSFISLTDESDMVVAMVVLEKSDTDAADLLSGDEAASPF